MMNRLTSITFFSVAVASCGNPEAEIQKAARESLTQPDSAQFGEINTARVADTDYACATLTARNALGMPSRPMQVRLLKEAEGQWTVLQQVEDDTPESCMKQLAKDLSGENDSVPPSTFQAKAPKPTKEASTPFDRQEIKWFEAYGDNVIQGSVAMKSRSGETYSCGSKSDAVALIPASRYAQERMILLYGNTNSGFHGSDSPLVDGDPLYLRMIKETSCDAAGRFIFERVPDGDYFLTTSVFWDVQKPAPAAPLQGGFLMKRVQVSGGEVEKVSLIAS